MPWEILFNPAFELEFDALSSTVQDRILERVMVLAEFGPSLDRPNVDTLNQSRHSSMKELRFNADNGVWWVAFAFDPNRRAVLLGAGNKAGVSERLFYRELVGKADDRFEAHLARIRQERREST